MLTDKQVRQIEAFAMKKYEALDSTHGPEHAVRTVRLAQYIAREEGGDETICRLGALLHQYHPREAALVDGFLIGLGAVSYTHLTLPTKA